MYEMTYEYRLHAIADSLQKYGHNITVLSAKNSQVLEKRNYNIKQIKIVLRKKQKYSIAKMIRIFEYYVKFFIHGLRIKSDIIIASDVMMLPIGYMIKKINGAKLVYDMRELWPWTKNSGLRIWKIIDRTLINKADEWIVVNDLRKNFIEKEYNTLKEGKILHPYPYLLKNISQGRLRKFLTEKGSTSNFTVLYKGGILPGNNLEILIDAAELFDESISLIILGFNDSKIYLNSLIERANKSKKKNVFFHPPVISTEIMSYVAEASVGIVSYSANCINSDLCEPCKLYDFMMQGVPTIVSSVKGTEAIINKYKTGILISFNYQEIGSQINNLKKNPTLYNELKNNSILYSSKLNWENEQEKLFDIINNLSEE